MRTLAAALCLISVSFAAETQLGRPLTLKKQTPIAALKAQPADYLDKTVQVRGQVTEVCQMMGCWMALVDPASKATVKIKVKDGEIVFPKDSVGKTAIAEGKYVKLEMTKEQAVEQAKHEAEANGRKFDPASITGPVTSYQIAGTGAVIQ